MPFLSLVEWVICADAEKNQVDPADRAANF